MPDGSVIIDTKINTDGVEDGAKEIKKQMTQTADVGESCAENIDKAFEKVDVSGVAEGLAEGFAEESASVLRTVEEMASDLPEPLKNAYDRIKQIREDDSADQKTKAARIAGVYKELGQNNADAMKKAWSVVKSESEKGSREVIDNLNDIAKEAKETGQDIEKSLGGSSGSGGLGGSLGGLGKLLGKSIAGIATVAALKEAAEAVVEFGKESMALGSDLQEVQNVVDVTFTTMSEKVNEFAKSADDSAGLSETMAKEYAGTFGTMAKSMGFAEAEAYELATALTQFTGDLASFRNLSQDEAFTKLQAIFTGETESLKALGVVMTQTNLDAFALANGFGKTTDAMTEAEKVSLRYRYVMDQLSAAQGDFVRTSDSWANQTRVLELQLDSLKATIGQGLIGVLTPFVELINDSVLPALQDMAEGFAEAFEPTPAEEFQGSINRLKDTMSDVDTEFAAAIAEIERTSFAVDACVESMTELETSGLDTAEAQNQYAAAVEYLNSLLPDLNAQIDKNTGLIDKNTQEIYKNLDAMKQQVKYKAYQKLLESHEAAINDLAAAEAELYKTQWERQGLEQQLQEIYGYSLEQIHELGMGVLEMNVAMDGGIGSADDMALAFGKVDKSVSGLTPELQEMLLEVIDLTSQEKGLNTAIAEMNATLAESDPMLKAFMEDVMGISDAAGEAAENLEGMTGSVASGTSGVLSGTSDIVAGVLDELSLETDKTYSELTQGLENNADVIRQHAENLAALMASGASDELIREFTNANSETMAALNEAMKASNGQFTELISSFDEYGRATEELNQLISDWEHQQALTNAAGKESISDIWAEYQQQSVDWIESRVSLINTKADDAKSDARMLVNEAEALADEANELFDKALEAREEGNYSQAARYQEMARQKQEEARKILQEAQALFDEASKLEGKVSQTAGIVADVAKKIEGQVGETAKSISQNISDVEQHLTDTLGTSEGVISEMGDGIVDTVSGAADEVKDVISDAATTSGKKIQEAVQESTKISEQGAERIERIANECLDGIMDQAVRDFTDTADKVQQIIDGIDGTVYVDVIQRQYPQTYSGGYTMPIGIPYLAEGAVIPPNAPFMAVLGDQRHGTNLEAPADLIRQIVREEMEGADFGGDITINFGGDLAGLASILAPVITREQRRNSRAGGY